MNSSCPRDAITAKRPHRRAEEMALVIQFSNRRTSSHHQSQKMQESSLSNSPSNSAPFWEIWAIANLPSLPQRRHKESCSARELWGGPQRVQDVADCGEQAEQLPTRMRSWSGTGASNRSGPDANDRETVSDSDGPRLGPFESVPRDPLALAPYKSCAEQDGGRVSSVDKNLQSRGGRFGNAAHHNCATIRIQRPLGGRRGSFATLLRVSRGACLLGGLLLRSLRSCLGTKEQWAGC